MWKSRLLIVAFFVMIAFACASCKKSASVDDSPPATTLRIDDACLDMDSCCAEQCTGYCQGQGAKYFRHELNGPTCLCFCER